MNPITQYWIISAFCIFGWISFNHIAEQLPDKRFWKTLNEVLGGLCLTVAIIYVILALGLSLANSDHANNACKKQGYQSADTLSNGELRCFNPISNTEDTLIITPLPTAGDK